MAVRLEPRSFAFTPIAATGDGRFVDFRPYVASIADDGTVAFQATLLGGGSGAFSGDGARVIAHIDPDDSVGQVVSHPDIDRAGSLSVYAVSRSGAHGVYHLCAGVLRAVAETPAYEHIGPLGPTMREGTIAFRARARAGVDGLFVADDGTVTAVAETGARFTGFEGLPVVTRGGTVVFRAARHAGGQGIYRWTRGRLEAIAETGARFAALGRFPAADDRGAIVFCATSGGGASGVFGAGAGEPVSLVDTRAPFESFRGALVDDAGAVVFYATPRGGALGVYSGADPVADRILGLGDSFAGSTIVDFALNPVSINARGQLALRLELADRRQLIVRADPA